MLPCTQKITFHHWSMTKWFPMSLKSRPYSHFGIHAVPWVPFSSLVKFLTSIIGFHYRSLLRRSLMCVIPSGACERRTHVCVHLIFHLHPPKYLVFFFSSCWMKGDALIPPFQYISSHRLRLIFL
jgi:hypothetical protein